MYKRVLVTGGASGLGKALALCWAKHGSDICIADLNDERAAETLAELKELKVDAFYCRCDITQQTDVDQLKQALVDKWQGVDLVINNAGIASADSLVDEDIEEWQRVMNVNLFGAVRVTKALIPLMQQQNEGYFLNVASQAGITPVSRMGSYNASKAAMVSFSETMRHELAPDNIGVSVLCPSFFKTNLKESMSTKDEGLRAVVDKVMERATVTAEDVAGYSYDAVEQNQFMIVTHKEGRSIYRLKRWFPNFYMKKATQMASRMGKAK
ncbi:MAG: SDR family oxidoreductase [Kangiellaceae bacterium]|jgi:NAD(P)-dependent dehydrogenase (short-subunit alcohol dehydrogenase family)|nr:SDR family oxidoreductase [Kangiellaceae bacterium]